MSTFRRTAVILALAGAGLFAAAGCGPAASGPAAPAAPAAAAAELGPEAEALETVGFETGLAPAAVEPSPGPKDKGDKSGRGWRKRAARGWLRHNTLHGELVVQTKDGPKTIVVQRGAVTAISETSVTVKSSDGFTLTWTFGDKLRVVEHRASVRPDTIDAGDEIGVAGVRDGDKIVARLIVKRP